MNPVGFFAHGAMIRAGRAIAVLALLAALDGCGAKSSNGAATTTPPPAGSAGSGASAASDSAAHPAAAGGGIEPGAELGERVFKVRCVLCHGPEGRGNGVAAGSLRPNPPRNFHDAAYMTSRTDDQLLLSIHNGKNAMPPWKGILSEVEMKSVLMYVRKFAAKP
jgi:mono/diheme cytochrome c family protein